MGAQTRTAANIHAIADLAHFADCEAEVISIPKSETAP
jgi:hypothetical protein